MLLPNLIHLQTKNICRTARAVLYRLLYILFVDWQNFLKIYRLSDILNDEFMILLFFVGNIFLSIDRYNIHNNTLLMFHLDLMVQWLESVIPTLGVDGSNLDWTRTDFLRTLCVFSLYRYPLWSLYIWIIYFSLHRLFLVRLTKV